AMAFPVLYRTKDALAEQAVLLRLERPVVDRLGLENFAPGPPVTQAGHCKPLALLGVLRAADLLWRGDPDLDVVERRRARLARIAKINHSLLPAPVAAAVTLSGDEAVTLGVHPGGEPGFVGTHSYVDTKRLQLLHENVERLWRSRLRQVLSLHNRFINLATTVHVVRLTVRISCKVCAAPYASSAHTSISPKRWPPNCALPASGCCVTNEYGPMLRA